ncbi:MAG: hypothetical protein ABIP12_06425, partial [Terriglobales bacterium]
MRYLLDDAQGANDADGLGCHRMVPVSRNDPRKRGIASAAKKATRVTSEGSVSSYIHAGGKIGVLLEVNCESDFVAR